MFYTSLTYKTICFMHNYNKIITFYLFLY